MFKFESKKQKRIRKNKEAIVFARAIDFCSHEAKKNREAGIIDLFPISSAINLTNKIIEMGLLDITYKLIVGYKTKKKKGLQNG